MYIRGSGIDGILKNRSQQINHCRVRSALLSEGFDGIYLEGIFGNLCLQLIRKLGDGIRISVKHGNTADNLSLGRNDKINIVLIETIRYLVTRRIIQRIRKGHCNDITAGYRVRVPGNGQGVECPGHGFRQKLNGTGIDVNLGQIVKYRHVELLPQSLADIPL